MITVFDVLGQKEMLSWCLFDTVSVSSWLFGECFFVGAASVAKRLAIRVPACKA
jgi:hypothetical protein